MLYDRDYHQSLGGADRPRFFGVDKPGWFCLGGGAVVAFLLLMFSSLFKFALSYLNVLVHEIGHSLFFLIYGYPSLPTIDFRYGGGIAISADRIPLLLIIPFAFLVWIIFRTIKQQAWIWTGIFLFVSVIYGVTAFTGSHMLLCILGGHLCETVIAGIFLFRAMSGSSMVSPLERPIYALLGWFMLFYDIQFYYALLFNKVERLVYLMGKGGVMDNDFVVAANEMRGLTLNRQVWFFIIICVLTPLIACAFNMLYQHFKKCQELKETD